MSTSRRFAVLRALVEEEVCTPPTPTSGDTCGRGRAPSRAQPGHSLPGCPCAAMRKKLRVPVGYRSSSVVRPFVRVRRAEHRERPALGLVRDRYLGVRARGLVRAEDGDDTKVACVRLGVRRAAEEVEAARLCRGVVARLVPDREARPLRTLAARGRKRIASTIGCCSAATIAFEGEIGDEQDVGLALPLEVDVTADRRWQSRRSLDGGAAVVAQTLRRRLRRLAGRVASIRRRVVVVGRCDRQCRRSRSSPTPHRRRTTRRRPRCPSSIAVLLASGYAPQSSSVLEVRDPDGAASDRRADPRPPGDIDRHALSDGVGYRYRSPYVVRLRR